MTWTGITKEMTYVQQTGHRVPNFPFRAEDEALVLRDPCPGGDGVALLNGQFIRAWERAGCANLLAVELQKALVGRRVGFFN